LSFRIGLLASNSVFLFFREIFVSLSLLEDSFTEYRILGLQGLLFVLFFSTF
jgi:hypothetical protein